MDTNERRDRIFEFIVDSYIDTAEPVGSRTLSKMSGVGLSPASIRNVMADLEEDGYLMHPHTSAGRIPTDKGYRYYVDQLMEPDPVDDHVKQSLIQQIEKSRSLEDLAMRLSKMISEITDNTAVVHLRNVKRVSFLTGIINEILKQQEQLLERMHEESELYIEGAFRLLKKPEFSDASLFSEVLQAFEEKSALELLFQHEEIDDRVYVSIGSEIDLRTLERMSLVTKDCYYGNHAIASVAVLGPTRMDYAKVIPLVDYVADEMTHSLRGY